MKQLTNMAAASVAIAGLGMTALANDRGDDANPSGQIYLANEARFTSRSFSEPLTNYALMWRDPNNIEATLDFLFPPVQVARRYEWKKAVNAEAFLSETDDERAIGGDFKVVEYKGTSELGKTINKGLSMKVDFDEVEGMPEWANIYTAMLMDRLYRSELRRAVTAALTAANNNAKTWDGTTPKDPDMDVMNFLKTGRGKRGIRGNRVLYGDGAWTARMATLRAQTTAGGFANSGFTKEQLAGFLGVNEVRVSQELYQSSASAKTDVMGNLLLTFYAQNGTTKDDPSDMKRFWTPCRTGGKVAVYRRDHDKYATLTVEHYSNCTVTSSTGMEKGTITPP